jgi:hypothetical protein
MQTRLDHMPDASGRPSANRRAPVRNPQIVDGKQPLLDENPWKGPDGDEPPHSGVQHEEDDPNPRRRAANGGDYNLTGLGNPSRSAFLAHRCDVHQHSRFYTSSVDLARSLAVQDCAKADCRVVGYSCNQHHCASAALVGDLSVVDAVYCRLSTQPLLLGAPRLMTLLQHCVLLLRPKTYFKMDQFSGGGSSLLTISSQRARWSAIWSL